MNLFVVGTRSLSDWIFRMIEDTSDGLRAKTPPIALKITSDVARADVIVYEAHHRETVQPDETYAGIPRLCIVEPGSKILRSPHETLLFRSSGESDPAWLTALFDEAIRATFLQCHLLAFQRALSGPFSHDIRGALSVVSLARQLLESGGGGKLVAGRLSRVDSRIATALLDIEARSLCLSGTWPPSENHAQAGAPRSDEISEWFALTQSDRELETNDKALDEMRRAPAWFTVALAGCLDGVTRLTRGRIEVTTGDRVDCSFSVRVAGEDPKLDESQLSSLDEPERWPLLSTHAIPYRLGTAALLVEAAGGSVLARVHAGQLSVELRLP